MRLGHHGQVYGLHGGGYIVADYTQAVFFSMKDPGRLDAVCTGLASSLSNHTHFTVLQLPEFDLAVMTQQMHGLQLVYQAAMHLMTTVLRTTSCSHSRR